MTRRLVSDAFAIYDRAEDEVLFKDDVPLLYSSEGEAGSLTLRLNGEALYDGRPRYEVVTLKIYQAIEACRSRQA